MRYRRSRGGGGKSGPAAFAAPPPRALARILPPRRPPAAFPAAFLPLRLKAFGRRFGEIAGGEPSRENGERAQPLLPSCDQSHDLGRRSRRHPIEFRAKRHRTPEFQSDIESRRGNAARETF